MSLPRIFILTVLLLAAFLPPVVRAADEVQEANKLYERGQYDAALDKLNAYLARSQNRQQSGSDTGQDSQVTLARFLKGVILSEQDKTEEAITIFRALTDEFPELPEPYNNLAVIYAGQGEYDKARQSLEMAIRTHPSYATAHENLGDIYAKLASQSYDKALRLDRGNASAQTKLAQVKGLFSQEIKVSSSGKAKVAAEVEPPAKVAIAERKAVAESPISEEVPPLPVPSGEEEVVLAAVNGWASSWSGQNVGRYLASYSPEFDPLDGSDRAAWEASRRVRIEAPKKISLIIRDAKVSVVGDRATVVFRQDYRSDRFRSTARKTLVFEKREGEWLIVRERVN